MLYFFYGADDYRLKQKTKSVVAGYLAKHSSGLNLARFDLSDRAEFARLKDFLEAYSMFEEKKLAVIENLFGGASVDEFAGFLASSVIFKDNEKFVVVAQELKLADRKSKEKYVFKNENEKELFKQLTGRLAQKEEFDSLTGVRLEDWIKKEVERVGGSAELTQGRAERDAKIDSAAVKKLAVFVGSDLWRMSNEINKLANYQAGQTIGAADVEELVKSKIDNDIFKTVDALALRQKNIAYKLLHRHLAEGESEIYLLGMLIFQFRNLLLVKSQIEQGATVAEIGQNIKLHPFVLRKTFEQARNFTLADLKTIYGKFLEADLAIKSGRVEPPAALDLLVAEIAK